MTIALLFSLGTCIAQMQSVCVNFASTKRLFILLAEAIINVHNVGLCARCAIFLLKNKQTPFFCRLVKEFTFLKRDPIQFKKLLLMCIVLESESIGGYVTTPRSIHGCAKCGAWLFVHKVLFKLQEHVMTTKTEKITLLLC